MRAGDAAAEVHAAQVGGDHIVPFGRFDLEERPCDRHRGVVYPDVDVAVCVGGGGEARLDRVEVAYVELDRERPTRRGRPCTLDVDVRVDDAVPVGREPVGDRLPEPARRAGDDCNTVLVAHVAHYRPRRPEAALCDPGAGG